MELPRRMNLAATFAGTDSLRRWAVRLAIALVIVVALFDLMSALSDGPAMKHFFPRFYVWLFATAMALLTWSVVKALDRRRWQVAVLAVVGVAAVLAAAGVSSSFPMLAPGQETTEGERVVKVDPITFGFLGLQIRPDALDNKMDEVVHWLVKRYRPLFQWITGNLLKALVPLEKALIAMPWWLFIGAVVMVAWRVSGYRIAMVSLGGLLFIGIFRLWEPAMRTMVVVSTATALSIASAIPVGIAMAKSDRLQALMKPILDLMQVMPAFVYLIPAIFFLGLGKVPAVMATMIYAVPPAIRLTNLGIRLVSPGLIEAARAFGTTPWQLLIKIQLPLARPTIMAGLNQTIMMALAMVVLASMVGAKGLGADVLAGINQLEFGRGLMAGLGIVVLAIIIDRITQGLAKDPRT